MLRLSSLETENFVDHLDLLGNIADQVHLGTRLRFAVKRHRRK